MATGDLSTDEVRALREERDAWEARCVAAEQEVARLRAELDAERTAHDTGVLSLFDGLPADPVEGRGDGSDQQVVSMLLAATAVIAGLVAGLALLNGRLGSPTGLGAVVLAVGLGWAAARTRVIPVEVVVERGVVRIVQGENAHRFDLRKPTTVVEVVGRPEDAGWAVRFPRRFDEPFVVDRTMVDPATFLAQLREFRPEL